MAYTPGRLRTRKNDQEAADDMVVMDERGLSVADTAPGNPDMSVQEATANAARFVAAWNFFYGREIATARMSDGGFWDITDCLKGLLDTIKGINDADESEKSFWGKKIEAEYRNGRALLTKLGIEP